MTVPTNNEEALPDHSAVIEAVVDVMLSADCFTEDTRHHEATRDSLRDMAYALLGADMLAAARRPPVSGDNAELIAKADDLRGMPDGEIQALVGDLRFALISASQPREVEVTDDMVERMARVLFAQTTEARSGFTWPINGEWGRERDMKQARGVLVRVLGPSAALGGGE